MKRIILTVVGGLLVLGMCSADGGCTACQYWTADATMSSFAMVTPHFGYRWSWFELVGGITASTISDTTSAVAVKMVTSEQTGRYYVFEVDSYAFQTFGMMIKPEIIGRFYPQAFSDVAPFIGLGFFGFIPYVEAKYDEVFIRYDETGNVVSQFQATASGNPSNVRPKKIFEMGVLAQVGAGYWMSDHACLFAELDARYFIISAEGEYSYRKRAVNWANSTWQEWHYWSGGTNTTTFNVGGAIGLRLYW